MFTVDVVFGGEGAHVVDGGDGDVSIEADQTSRRELLLKLRHLREDGCETCSEQGRRHLD